MKIWHLQFFCALKRFVNILSMWLYKCGIWEFCGYTELIGHEQVINELEADTINKDCCLGVNGSRFKPGSYASLMTLYVKVSGLRLTRRTLHKTQQGVTICTNVYRFVQNLVLKFGAASLIISSGHEPDC